jgi:hypothetical protein
VKEKDYSRHISVDRRIILNWILRKYETISYGMDYVTQGKAQWRIIVNIYMDNWAAFPDISVTVSFV